MNIMMQAAIVVTARLHYLRYKTCTGVDLFRIAEPDLALRSLHPSIKVQNTFLIGEIHKKEFKRLRHPLVDPLLL